MIQVHSPLHQSAPVTITLPPLNTIQAVKSLGDDEVRGYLHGYYGEPLDEMAEGYGWKESTSLVEKRKFVLMAIGADVRVS